MDSKFLSAVFANPPELLGKKLRPFSLGHSVILAALKSCFISGGDVNAEELLVAVWVCSNKFEEGRRRLVEDLKGLESEFYEMGKLVGDFNTREVSEIFQAYLTEHTRAPDRWQSKEQHSSKAPWALTIATTLMKEFKLSPEKAWDMPLQEALWYFASIAESNGDKSLISEEERLRLKAAKEKRIAEVEVQNGNG